MFIYIIICLVITQTGGFHTEHSHNKVVRRKTDYKVNISMPDDVEMVDLDNLMQYSNTGIKFSKTHKRPHRKAKTRNLVSKYNHTTLFQATETVLNLSHVDVVNSTQYNDNSVTKSTNGNATSEEKSNETYHTVPDADKSELDENSNPPRLAREISADRIWNIVRTWLIVYIVLAVPLWCSIGRCCCCLVCKCFRAQETIREAKQYAMWNPPGVLRKKSGDINYMPSEKEQEAYEELEHLIRTL